MGVYYDILGVKGGYYHFGEQTWHGRAALEEELRNNPALHGALQSAVLEVSTKGKQRPARRLTRTKK
jgi:hypothetical protein